MSASYCDYTVLWQHRNKLYTVFMEPLNHIRMSVFSFNTLENVRTNLKAQKYVV